MLRSVRKPVTNRYANSFTSCSKGSTVGSGGWVGRWLGVPAAVTSGSEAAFPRLHEPGQQNTMG